MFWDIDSSVKKVFIKSKGGEGGKEKMGGPFEDEMTFYMMNPDKFDC